MDDVIKNSYIQFGAIGFLVAFLATAIKKLWTYIGTLAQQHKDERGQWREETNKMTHEVLRVVEGNSSIISRLSTQINGLDKQQ